MIVDVQIIIAKIYRSATFYDSYDRKCNFFQIATVNHGSYLFTGTRGGMIEGYKIPVSASDDE